jgi:hypothetical protein
MSTLEQIPHAAEGYAVEQATPGVHRRYAGHAPDGARKTRTRRGLEALLAGRRGEPCIECFPAPLPVEPVEVRAEKARRPRARVQIQNFDAEGRDLSTAQAIAAFTSEPSVAAIDEGDETPADDPEASATGEAGTPPAEEG